LKLTLNKTEFLDAIKLVKNAVNTRDIMPITKCVLLSADGEGLKLTATDMEMSVESSKIQCDVEKTGSVAIDAKLLSDMAAKLPDEIVTLSGDEKGFAIKSGQFRAQIFGQMADEFPLVDMSDIRSDYAGVTERDFLKLLKGTAFSACQMEGMKPALTGILIEVSDGALTMTTSDSYRVSRRRVRSNFNNHGKILFQGSCGNKLLKLLNPKSDDLLWFTTTDFHFIIVSEKWKITMRLMTDEYPDFSMFFNNTASTIIETDAAALLNSLERMKIITAKSSSKVTFEQNANTLVLSAGDAAGRASDEIDASISGAPITVCFNIDYLLSIMKTIQDETIKIELSSPIKPAYFLGNNADYEYLVLPMRG